MAATSRSGNLISAFSCRGARACSQRTAVRPRSLRARLPFVSARLVPRPGGHAAGGHGDYARSIRLAGADWLLASAADPPSPAPVLPR
jgi:hypothetical protein